MSKNNKAEDKLNTIGFVFGFKDTSQLKSEDGVKFIVKNKTGVSDSFPKKYETKKDFWVEEIKDGQVNNIYIDPKEICEGFEKELASLKEDIEFVNDSYNNERYLLTFPLKQEDFMVLMAMSRSQLHVYMNERWESEDVFENVMNKIGYEHLKNKELLSKKTPIEMLREYQEVRVFLYEKSLETLSSDAVEPDKVNEDNLVQMQEDLKSFKGSKKKI